MEEFFSFRRFITPSVITIIFWVGVALSVIAGLVMIVTAITGNAPAVTVLLGLLYIVIGPLVVRIYCELIILGFKIFDTINEIRDLQAGGGQHPQQTPSEPGY